MFLPISFLKDFMLDEETKNSDFICRKKNYVLKLFGILLSLGRFLTRGCNEACFLIEIDFKHISNYWWHGGAMQSQMKIFACPPQQSY